jgi:hypothetical protein
MRRNSNDLISKNYGDVIVPLLVEHDLLLEEQVDEYRNYLKEEFVENS